MTHEVLHLQQQSHETLTLNGKAAMPAMPVMSVMPLAWRVKGASQKDGYKAVSRGAQYPIDPQEDP